MSPDRPVILCVDDEPRVLEALGDMLRRSYRVHVAGQGFEALRILTQEPVEVVVSDMRMPVLDGGRFLGMARERAPDVTRIVLTGQSDASAALSAVNDGEVFRFLTKPVSRQALLDAIDAGVLRHRATLAERRVLEETVRGATELLAEVLGAADPVAQGRAARVTALVRRAAPALGIADDWVLEVATSLTQLGTLGLPAELAVRLNAGLPLEAGEREAVVGALRTAGRMLRRIPRLDAVADVLDPAGPPTALAELLRAAVELDLLCAGLTARDARRVLRDSGHCRAEVLDALGEGEEADGAGTRVRDHALALVPAGSVLAQDVRLPDGTLLVARGVAVTPAMTLRLVQVGARHPDARAFVHEPVDED